MRSRFASAFAILIGLMAMLGIGLLAGRFLWQEKPAPEPERVTSQTILTALREQGFLVTQSVVSSQDVTIERSTGSAFKDFFVGQTIRARATMETNIGINLSELSASNIAIEEGRILIGIPDVQIFNTTPIGSIEVENSQGFVKRLLEPDDGYNTALGELKKASEALATEASVLANARERSKEEIRRLLKLVIPNSLEIDVNIVR